MSAANIKTEEEVILENAEYNSAEELEEELHLQLDDSGGESYQIHYHSEPATTVVGQHHIRQRSQQQGGGSSMNSNGSSAGKNSGGGGGGGGSGSDGGGGTNNKNLLESEKRMRREIANSNERRRMQSINAGFQNLRSLLPRQEGEKLSKAAILQQTSQYICELENQKTQLLAQNSQLKRQLGQHEGPNGGGGGGAESGHNGDGAGNGNDPLSGSGVAIKKRKLTDNVINIQAISDSSDEGLGSMSPEPMTLLNAAGLTTAVAVGGGGGGAKSQVSTTIIAHTTKELVEMKKQLEKERRLRSILEEELQTIKRQLYSVATAPTTAVGTTTFIPREVIEHTDNLVRDNLEELPPGTVSYVEIDELGQQQVVVCSSIEELEHEANAAAADIITEENIQEEVILSSTSSTESESEVNVNAIAKAYAEGKCPNNSTVLQPILQAAIKATPKVEVERINETVMKVKMEKIEQPSGLTRSRQNLETIVEAIRHLEGDHLFGEVAEQQKLHQHQQHHQHQQQHHNKAQDAPLALTTKQAVQAQRTTLAELRPYLQLKGNNQLTIVGGSGASVTLTHQQLAAAASKVNSLQKDNSRSGAANVGSSNSSSGATANNSTTITTTSSSSSSCSQVTPTALYKVQRTGSAATTSPGGAEAGGGGSGASIGGGASQQITITTSALKQCRPGVIVAKQLS